MKWSTLHPGHPMRCVSTGEARGSSGRGAWLVLAACLAVAGCAGVAPPKKEAEGARADQRGFTITEKARFDSGVRADFDAATALLQAEQYEKAIALLTQVIEREKSAVAPYVNIAIAYKQVDKLDLAEANLKKALELNPTHPVAANEAGLLYRQTGRFLEGRAIYERVLDKYPDFLPVRKNLAVLCDIYLADLDCALRHYEIYAEAAPNDKDVEIWIADLKRRLGR